MKNSMTFFMLVVYMIILVVSVESVSPKTETKIVEKTSQKTIEEVQFLRKQLEKERSEKSKGFSYYEKQIEGLKSELNKQENKKIDVKNFSKRDVIVVEKSQYNNPGVYVNIESLNN